MQAAINETAIKVYVVWWSAAYYTLCNPKGIFFQVL